MPIVCRLMILIYLIKWGISLYLRRLRHGLPPLLDDSKSHYVPKMV